MICTRLCMRAHLVLALICTQSVIAMNIVQPYDILIRPEWHKDRTISSFIMMEGAYGVTSFNRVGQHVNPLQIYSCSQDAIAMLEGSAPDSDIGALLTRIDAPDDGTRGHINMFGDFDVHYGGTAAVRWLFPHNLSFGMYMPFYSMSLRNVSWCNLTQNINAADARVNQYLLNNDFANLVCELGNGLQLCGWKRSGPGDLLCQGEWLADFPQPKPLLKNVKLNARLGVTLPSGLRKNENDVLAVPFGWDGAFGLLYAGAIDLQLGEQFRCGLDVQLLQLFGNIRDRRIKTSLTQTEFLLLHKTPAYKDWGMTQQFSLYVEAWRICNMFTAKVGYQYFKHGDDSLSLLGNRFSTAIANTSRDLADWTVHHLTTFLTFDPIDWTECWRAQPTLSLFVKSAFNGKRSIDASVVGVVFQVDF